MTLIIEIKYGGLGDHLFLSHIPRIAKNFGYKKVYISNKSIFRNNEILELIWKSNPYVDGFTNDRSKVAKPLKVENGNLLDGWMLAFGIDDGLRYHEPEIYYKPIFKNEFKNVNLYDLNYISYVGSIDKSLIIIDKYEKNIQLKNNSGMEINSIESIESYSLKNYCDIISSCKNFYCLSSGSATIAAALKVNSTVFYGNGQDKIFHHSHLHNYIDIGDYSIKGYLHSFYLRNKNRFKNLIK